MEVAYNYLSEFKISDARKHLGGIFDFVSTSGKPVWLTKNRETVGIVPNLLMKLFEDDSLQNTLSVVIVFHLFKNAPLHIAVSQIRDFEKLPFNKLKAAIDIKNLPLSATTKPKFEKMLGKQFVERLEKRFKIAKAIAEAEAEGLYEAAEYQTGMIQLNK